MIDRYLQEQNLGFNLTQLATCRENMQQMIEEQFNSLRNFVAGQPTVDSVPCDGELYSYPVPELGEGGSCSLFNQVADQPFDLTTVLGTPTDYTRKTLQKLHQVVEYVVGKTQTDWFGIYQTFGHEQQDKRLVKLAYDGAISRSEYPLTEQFAQISNNVQVGLSGESKVINNVDSYVEQGGSYYTCDPKVKSEVCLPIFDSKNQVIGIIDAEAFVNDFFDAQRMALLVAASLVISSLLPALQM